MLITAESHYDYVSGDLMGRKLCSHSRDLLESSQDNMGRTKIGPVDHTSGFNAVPQQQIEKGSQDGMAYSSSGNEIKLGHLP